MDTLVSHGWFPNPSSLGEYPLPARFRRVQFY